MFLFSSSRDTLYQHALIENIILFKHSTACSISRAAYERISTGIQTGLITVPVYLIIVQEQRDLSNEIADIFNIPHASPQILVIKNTLCVFHASHTAITIENILNQKNISCIGENICLE